MVRIFASIFVGWLIANLRVVFMCFICSLWSRFMVWLDGFDLWVGNMGFIHQLEPVFLYGLDFFLPRFDLE